MNECEKLHHDLKAFLDGQLSPASRIALRLHLNRCESCRKELEEMRQLGTRLRADDTLEMSDALRARILASVPTAAPEAKVKMLPRWREKPVMLWGASASAAIAWFLLYPAINNYQPSSSANKRKAIAMGTLSYAQDHDEATPGIQGWQDGMAPAPYAHANVSGKNDEDVNLYIQQGNGRASGTSELARQDPRIARMQGQNHVTSTPTEPNANVYFAREETDKGSPYFPHANGLAPLKGNGNGNPVGSAGENHTLRGTLRPQSVKDGTVPPPPYVFSAIEPIRLQPPTLNGATTSNLHSDGKYPLSHDGLLSSRDHLQIAQNSRTEKLETDPSKSGTTAPLHTRRGTMAAAEAQDHKIYYRDNGQDGQVLDAPIDANAKPIRPYNPTPTGHFRPATNQTSNVSGIRNGEPRAYADFADDLPTERQVHREASLTVEVANAEQQTEAVERLVKESKGYVAQNQLSTQEDNTRQASLTCKVPVDQFDTVMGQIARLGLLKGKTLSGEDITEKVSDEQETGHVLRADIATTQEKLKTRRKRSETIHDEETLRQLRIRVAQSQARLKMLTRLGALSEITVELDEKPKNPAPEVKPASPFMEEVSGTGQAAAHSFLMALRLPVQLLVWIVVYSPLWALLIYGYRRMTR